MSNFVRKYIHLLFAVVSSLLVFLINGFEYFSNIYYPPIYYAKEILLIISLLFSTFFWNRLEEKKTDIQYYQNRHLNYYENITKYIGQMIGFSKD